MATRRKFVMQAAALAAAPFISTTVTRALAATAKKKLGFALCGLGSLSTAQIAPALQKTANCRLAGIITGTPAKAKTLPSGVARRPTIGPAVIRRTGPIPVWRPSSAGRSTP